MPAVEEYTLHVLLLSKPIRFWFHRAVQPVLLASMRPLGRRHALVRASAGSKYRYAPWLLMPTGRVPHLARALQLARRARIPAHRRRVPAPVRLWKQTTPSRAGTDANLINRWSYVLFDQRARLARRNRVLGRPRAHVCASKRGWKKSFGCTAVIDPTYCFVCLCFLRPQLAHPARSLRLPSPHRAQVQ